MKNANELRIAAYAVVDVTDGVVCTLHHKRQDARTTLQNVKYQTGDVQGFKIIKLKVDKFIR